MKKTHEQAIVRAMIAVTFFICGGAIAEAAVAHKLANEASHVHSCQDNRHK